jgi:hypothetical protein
MHFRVCVRSGLLHLSDSGRDAEITPYKPRQKKSMFHSHSIRQDQSTSSVSHYWTNISVVGAFW